jgi:hypothetical protein
MKIIAWDVYNHGKSGLYIGHLCMHVLLVVSNLWRIYIYNVMHYIIHVRMYRFDPLSMHVYRSCALFCVMITVKPLYYKPVVCM